LANTNLESSIVTIRGLKVILDADLAKIYGVTTKRLNEQTKRNSARFPEEFMFQLTNDEMNNLRSHFATSSLHGGRRYLPYAFTEHGAIMAANVLNSPKAIEMSVFVVRAFIKMRETLANNKALALKLVELEKKLTERLDIHERAIVHVLEEVRKLMAPSEPSKRKIGFEVKEKVAVYKTKSNRITGLRGKYNGKGLLTSLMNEKKHEKELLKKKRLD
jgi:phage regulator Rha-like protein